MSLRPLILATALMLPACDRVMPVAANSATPELEEEAVSAPTPTGEVVIVSVAGVEPGGEPVDAALQAEADWGTERATYRARVPAEADAVALRVTGVTPGRYGVVAVQPVLPPVDRAGRGSEGAGPAGAETAAASGPSPPPSLKPGRGGWAASGADGPRAPDWKDAAIVVADEGATVPLTLRR